MKITYAKGNLLDAESGVILHGCNAQGVMGSGVARYVREKYPEAYAKYNKYCKQNAYSKTLVGSTIMYKVPDKELWVANAITQFAFGADGTRYVSYSAIEDVFRFVDNNFGSYQTLHIPKIGAGLGGGDWDTISSLIEQNITQFKEIKCWVI